MPYRTNVVAGEALRDLTRPVPPFKKRDCFSKLERYLYGGSDPARVCAMYGLRRTGKTTVLFQAIAGMSEEDAARTVYTKMRVTDKMEDLVADLRRLREEGYKYIFVDEATLMDDFISSAALLSDIYAMMGMRIVLSGTDSLGFWLAKDNELYDRVRLIHTTFIPFREYSRLLGIDSVDEYIRYGGLLRAGEVAFDDEDALTEEASFRDDEAARRYVDAAIARNIGHSLARERDSGLFGSLKELYDAGELSGAVNRIIEDMNHRFLADVLTRDFSSSDLALSSRNLKSERDPGKRTGILDAVGIKAVTEQMMRLLDIKNSSDRTVLVFSRQAEQIEAYLKALDLTVECPVRAGEEGVTNSERVLFTRPGMRYCQAQALVYALMRDDAFSRLSDAEKTYISERILEEVRGRMLEDIVLLETMKTVGRRYSVFKYGFRSGEYDMVIRDTGTDTCALCEIKHSGARVTEQARRLRDGNMLRLTESRLGAVVGRYVLYLGEDAETPDGISYRNIPEVLKALPRLEIQNIREPFAPEPVDFDR